MSFSRAVEQRGDRTLDILTDDATGLRLVVSRLGAELVSLARRDAKGNWLGFLYRDGELDPPTSGWANHATVMGYFLHRLKDGHSIYRGREIAGGTHSFLRTKVWTLSSPIRRDPHSLPIRGDPHSLPIRHSQTVHDSTPDSLVYKIGPDDYSPSEYPLRVSLTLTYRLRGPEILVIFDFENHEPDLVAHVSFGLHPGFAAASFDTFQLLMPGGRYRRYFSPGNYLSGETREFDFAGGPIPFSREELPGSFIVEFVDVPERRFTYRDSPSGREVVLDLANVPYFTLWSDGGPFLCVEPCWGLTDRHDQRPFEDKDGIQKIAPQGRLTASFTMTPRLIGS